MIISAETSVGELVRDVPESSGVLERHGIDFCCGGNRPLAEVCQEKGISLGELLAEVEQAKQSSASEPARDWNAASLEQLLDHILEKHHSYLRVELPRLTQLLGKVLQAHGANHADSLYPLRDFYTGLRKELEEHMWKEENVLFPLLRQMERAASSGAPFRGRAMSVQAPIGVMEMEHDSAGNALRQMRQVTLEYKLPEDGCNTYRELLEGLKVLEADLHQHIHLENNILFPRGLQLEESLSA